MTFSFVLASALLPGLILNAAVGNPPASDVVKICLIGDGEHFVFAQAEVIATHIFARIGIHLDWYHDDHHCKTPPPESLNVLVSVDAPENEAPGALAYSRLHHNPHIEVFYNRVLKTSGPQGVPKLLAYVLAHEIAHMLEGSGRHSEAGIMKAHWSESDITDMVFEPLSFTAVDASLIRQGLLQRKITAP